MTGVVRVQRKSLNILQFAIGINRKTIAKILFLIKKDQRFKNSPVTDSHILWCFNYWRQYNTIEQTCVTLGITSRTFQNYYGATLEILYQCFKKLMEERYNQLVEGADILVHPLTKKEFRSIAADSKSIPIQKPISYITQKEYYNAKKKVHTKKYHIEVNTNTRRLLYISKGYAGIVHDQKMADEIYTLKDENGKEILNENGVVSRLHDKYPILGDKAYQSLPNMVVPFKRNQSNGNKLTIEEKQHNHYISGNHVRIEHFFKQLKQFKVLSTIFRGDLEHLDKIVLVIGFVIDMERELGDGFDIDFDDDELDKIEEGFKSVIN